MEYVEARLGSDIDQLLRGCYVDDPDGTLDTAARALGTNPSTVSRWLRARGFQARVVGHRKSRS